MLFSPLSLLGEGVGGEVSQRGSILPGPVLSPPAGGCSEERRFVRNAQSLDALPPSSNSQRTRSSRSSLPIAPPGAPAFVSLRVQARDATNPSPPCACTPWPTEISDLRLSYEAVISTLNKRTGVPLLMLYATVDQGVPEPGGNRATPRARRSGRTPRRRPRCGPVAAAATHAWLRPCPSRRPP